MSLITDEARAWADQAFPQRQFEVGRSDIARYAYAIGATNPVHVDVDAARQAGHPDVVAPPYFGLVARMHAVNLTPRSGFVTDGSSSEEVPPLDTPRAMAGETELQIGVPVHAGDTLTVDKRIAELYEKQGRSGPMVFVTTEFAVHNQRSELVMVERYTRIYR